MKICSQKIHNVHRFCKPQSYFFLPFKLTTCWTWNTFSLICSVCELRKIFSQARRWWNKPKFFFARLRALLFCFTSESTDCFELLHSAIIKFHWSKVKENLRIYVYEMEKARPESTGLQTYWRFLYCWRLNVGRFWSGARALCNSFTN